MSSVKTWRRAALAGIHHRVGIFDGLLIGIRDFQGGQSLAITQCVQDLLR